MSDPSDFDSVENGISRAMAEGCMWLNSVFRFKDTPRRLFGKRGPRISKLEAFWGIVSGLIVCLSLIGLNRLFGDGGLFFIMWSWMAICLWTFIAMWNGRKIARMSPLRRRTGEGTGVWLWMAIKKGIVRVSFAIQRPVMFSQCMSRAGNSRRDEIVTECVVWLGTSRMPRMPYNYDPERSYDPITREFLSSKVELPPRGRRVPMDRVSRQAFLEELNS